MAQRKVRRALKSDAWPPALESCEGKIEDIEDIEKRNNVDASSVAKVRC
jgi:hypothetical protein